MPQKSTSTKTQSVQQLALAIQQESLQKKLEKNPDDVGALFASSFVSSSAKALGMESEASRNKRHARPKNTFKPRT